MMFANTLLGQQKIPRISTVTDCQMPFRFPTESLNSTRLEIYFVCKLFAPREMSHRPKMQHLFDREKISTRDDVRLCTCYLKQKRCIISKGQSCF